jgi:hypothetical protein
MSRMIFSFVATLTKAILTFREKRVKKVNFGGFNSISFVYLIEKPNSTIYLTRSRMQHHVMGTTST